MSKKKAERPAMACPCCDAPGLIPAQGRGRIDADGNDITHRDACRCRWCEWLWWDDPAPIVCAKCGASVVIVVDDRHAYAATLKEGAP